MPTFLIAHRHKDATEIDVKHIDTIVATYFRNKYGQDSELMDIDLIASEEE